MALYHLHVKNISRSHGRSVVAAAAYRAGETLENAAEERLSKFAGRRDVIHAEIHLPGDAPVWMAERANLWNAAEAAEKRKDARLAKEVEFSIPRELPRAAWLEVARAMATHYTNQGFIVDLAVHDDGTGHNPHVHLLLTTRAVTVAGFGQKLRGADRKTFLKDTRTTWQAIANAALAKAGIAIKIDASSYAARGIEREPGEHRPPDPAARRQRREEVASMVKDVDLKRAIAEMAHEPDIQDRYPILSTQPDWPPQQRPAPSLLQNNQTREAMQFWAEAETRAEQAQQPARASRQEARSFDEQVESLADRVHAASLKQGEQRRQAFAESARDYEKLHRSVSRDMVNAGHLKVENVRKWEAVERAFRDADFDELLAEARRIEAMRSEPDRRPRVTREQIAIVARHDREQAEHGAVEFKPPRPSREAAQQQIIRDAESHAGPNRSSAPDPFAAMAENSPASREGARVRMLEDYERDTASVTPAPRRPMDPDAWIAQQRAAVPRALDRPVERRVPRDPEAWRAAQARTTDRHTETEQEHERARDQER